MTKVKKTTQAGVSHEQAEQAAKEFASACNKLSAIEAKINKSIEDLYTKHNDEIVQLKSTLAQDGDLVQTLESYAIANKDNWDGKSLDLVHARIGFRLGTPKVDKPKGVSWDAVLEFVKSDKNLARSFVRVKEDLDKKAILDADAKTKEKLYAKAKITITQDETFYVDEHKQELL